MVQIDIDIKKTLRAIALSIFTMVRYLLIFIGISFGSIFAVVAIVLLFINYMMDEAMGMIDKRLGFKEDNEEDSE